MQQVLTKRARLPWKKDQYVTVKVTNTGPVNIASAEQEKISLQFLAEADPTHNGYRYITKLLDCFKIQGPGGRHLCLVFEPMREPLWLFQQNWPGNKFPVPIFKRIVRVLLEGVDYIHTKGRLIHTGTYLYSQSPASGGRSKLTSLQISSRTTSSSGSRTTGSFWTISRRRSRTHRRGNTHRTGLYISPKAISDPCKASQSSCRSPTLVCVSGRTTFAPGSRSGRRTVSRPPRPYLGLPGATPLTSGTLV